MKSMNVKSSELHTTCPGAILPYAPQDCVRQRHLETWSMCSPLSEQVTNEGVKCAVSRSTNLSYYIVFAYI